MKIILKKTDEQIALIQAMASKDRSVAMEAQDAFAAFMGPTLAKVVFNAPVLSNMFTSITVNEDDNASIPMDLYYNITDHNFVRVWSQTAAGGLGYSEMVPTTAEMKVATYNISTAYAFDRKYIAKSRLDVVSKGLQWIAEELLNKQESMSAGPVFSSLAAASTNGKAHVQRGNAADRFTLADLNELLTLARRVNTSFNKGTPATAQSRGVTDLLISPEMAEEVRAMAYNPINTKEAPYSSALKDSIPATDAMRTAIFNAAGLPSFYGITLIELNEFGVGAKYNTVFDVAAGSTNYSRPDGSTGAAAFDGTTTELLLGIDRSRDSLIRILTTDGNSEISFEADTQFSKRGSNKIGFAGGYDEGRVCLDDRVLFGKLI